MTPLGVEHDVNHAGVSVPTAANRHDAVRRSPPRCGLGREWSRGALNGSAPPTRFSLAQGAAMTPLRQRMIREMELRQFSPRTIECYVDAVAGLAMYYRRSPDQL